MNDYELAEKLKREGGPAFARGAGPEGGGWCNGDPGMTLRDWFAGMALQGILGGKGACIISEMMSYEEAAWTLADRMLAQREKS